MKVEFGLGTACLQLTLFLACLASPKPSLASTHNTVPR